MLMAGIKVRLTDWKLAGHAFKNALKDRTYTWLNNNKNNNSNNNNNYSEEN